MKLFNSISAHKAYLNNYSVKTHTPVSDYQELYAYLRKFESNNQKVQISIILPLYNEENTIRSILENLPSNNLVEIIVIDDNSSDNSLNEIRKVTNHKNFKIIRHKENRGYGNAIVTGIGYASGEVIVNMDTDGQHSPDDIFHLVKPIFDGDADYTIGSRYLGTYYYRIPILTRLGEVLIEKLIQLLFGIRIMNNQNGFRAFKKELGPLFSKAKFLGYAFCTEQILQARLSKYRIIERPIKVFNREYGSSGVVLRKLTLNIFACLLIYYIKKVKLNLFKKRRSMNYHALKSLDSQVKSR